MKLILILTTLMAAITVCLTDRSASSCAELLFDGFTDSGIYNIYPRPWFRSIPFQVYCDMQTEGGGWTLIQRRDDYEPRESFTRTWNEYKFGFGDLKKEFWLGNEKIFILTNQDHVELRIDLEDFDTNKRWAQYSSFNVNNEENLYKLLVSGYRGNAGDSLSELHNNSTFSTYDKNDLNQCAITYKGGYWYSKCHASNLNGLYLKGNHASNADGVDWVSWLGFHYSLKSSEMKIRPTNFLGSTCG